MRGPYGGGGGVVGCMSKSTTTWRQCLSTVQVLVSNCVLWYLIFSFYVELHLIYSMYTECSQSSVMIEEPFIVRAVRVDHVLRLSRYRRYFRLGHVSNITEHCYFWSFGYQLLTGRAKNVRKLDLTIENRLLNEPLGTCGSRWRKQTTLAPRRSDRDKLHSADKADGL